VVLTGCGKRSWGMRRSQEVTSRRVGLVVGLAASTDTTKCCATLWRSKAETNRSEKGRSTE
jgi:hypothetical protein